MEIHRFKQLRPKVVNNYTCISQTEDFDTLYSEKKKSDEKKSNKRYVNMPIHACDCRTDNFQS